MKPSKSRALLLMAAGPSGRRRSLIFGFVLGALLVSLALDSAPAAAQGAPAGAPPVVKSPAPGDAFKPDAGKPDAGKPDAGKAGALQEIVSFIRRNSTWILVVLGVVLAALVAWAFLGGARDREGKAESAFAELGLGEKSTGERGKRFSSTKIQAAEVNDRLTKGVKTTEVETEREYALVVDEEDLKMPPLPEEIDVHTGRQYAEAADIRKLLGEKKFIEAYEEYVRRIEADANLEFHSQVEQRLSEHFLRSRDFEKAARILEHHVATHAAEDVVAETYFNLGYIHFLNRTLNKSRRFLKLFVESEKNPQYVARATRILKTLESSGQLN